MKHISKDAYIKNDSALVLTLSKEAKEKKAKGINVVDATIGMLFDDNGNLASFKPMDLALKEAANLSNRKYTTVSGNIEYQNNVINWLFKDNPSTIKKYKLSTCATMGGTGALMLAVRNYVDNNKELLIPDIGWGNYSAICEQSERKYAYYKMFNGESLNIDDIKKVVLKYANKNKRVTLIINDPCHNPSGYSISENEWIQLIKFFNEINKKYPLTLILDVAYMDYSFNPRIYFKLLEKYKAQYLTLVAFSASKTLSVYGMRLGALVAISNNNEDIADFKLASVATARSTWSSPNAYVVSAFNTVIGNKNNYPLYEKYRIKHLNLLKNRYQDAKAFFDKIIKDGKILPYKEGFFLTYKVKDAIKTSDTLKKKNIYVLPMKKEYIRVAICSTINLK